MSIIPAKKPHDFYLTHDDLIEFMNLFHHLESKDEIVNEELHVGYKMDFKGICFGLACMAMQAALVNDLESFNNRLELISYCITEFKKIKGKLTVVQYDEWLTTSGSEEILEIIEQWLHVRQPKDNFDLEEIHKVLLDLNAFFDGITLYFKPEKHTMLLPKAVTQILSVDLVHTLIKPPLNSNENYKIDEIGAFCGCYDLGKIQLYLKELEKVIEKNKNQILITQEDYNLSFLLSSTKHTIMLNYNSSKKEWSLIDANQLSKKRDFDCRNNQDMFVMAKILLAAFPNIDNVSTFKIVGFSTRIFRAAPTSQQQLSNVSDLFNYPLLKGIPYSTIKTKLAATTVLCLSIEINDKETIENILKSHGKSIIDSTTDKYFIPLHIATECGYIEIVNMLLNAGANVNIKSDEGNTALHIAVQVGNVNIVRQLLNNRAKLNIQSMAGDTPLMLAVQFGYIKIIKELIKEENLSYNTIDLQNNQQKTALDLAIDLGNNYIIKTLAIYVLHIAKLNNNYDKYIKSLSLLKCTRTTLSESFEYYLYLNNTRKITNEQKLMFMEILLEKSYLLGQTSISATIEKDFKNLIATSEEFDDFHVLIGKISALIENNKPLRAKFGRLFGKFTCFGNNSVQVISLQHSSMYKPEPKNPNNSSNRR